MISYRFASGISFILFLLPFLSFYPVSFLIFSNSSLVCSYFLSSFSIVAFFICTFFFIFIFDYHFLFFLILTLLDHIRLLYFLMLLFQSVHSFLFRDMTSIY